MSTLIGSLWRGWLFPGSSSEDEDPNCAASMSFSASGPACSGQTRNSAGVLTLFFVSAMLVVSLVILVHAFG